MAIDPQLLTSQLFARLKTDALGLAVRAALGNGAGSVIHAVELEAKPLPACPFVALRPGPITGQSYDERTLLFDWWLYDLWPQRWYRINGLIPLIERAYPRTSLPFVEVVTANIGQEVDDTALNLRTRRLQLAIYTRG